MCRYCGEVIFRAGEHPGATGAFAPGEFLQI